MKESKRMAVKMAISAGALRVSAETLDYMSRVIHRPLFTVDDGPLGYTVERYIDDGGEFRRDDESFAPIVVHTLRCGHGKGCFPVHSRAYGYIDFSGELRFCTEIEDR